MQVYDITPTTKPRMTQKDKWKGRACVLKFFRFRDRVKELGITIPDSRSHVIFVVPMPESWSDKKKHAFNASAHQGALDKTVKNDLDNLQKALFDSMFKDDSHIWDVRMSKIWGYTGKIYTINFCLSTTWLNTVRYDLRNHDTVLGIGDFGRETR